MTLQEIVTFSKLSYYDGKLKTYIAGLLEPKANKSEMSVVAGTGDNADKTTITLKTGTSATVLTQHQDISGKAEKSEMAIADVAGDATKKTITLKSGLSQDVVVAHQDITGKADKVASATSGNFAGLDSEGNITDSGSKATDFASAAQGAKADSALQSIAKGTDGSYVTTSVSAKENNSQSVGVAVTIQGVATAGSNAMGLAEASDVKAYVDNKVASGINYKGSVQNYSALPANPNVGDMYNVLEDEGTPGTSGFHPGDMNYIWAAASGDDPSAEGYKPAHWDPQSPIIVVTECTNAQIDSLFS
jgi:hypothetical protein